MKISLAVLAILSIVAAVVFGVWATSLSHENMVLRFKLNDKLDSGLNHFQTSDSRPDNNWLGEPPPIHRIGTHDYWEQWCNKMFTHSIGGKTFRQDAMDWEDHCTKAGDAK